MRIITANVNGIRAAERKGFFHWLRRQQADFVCLQETKAQEHQLEGRDFFPRRYHVFYHDAQKKGYSGVALYCRHEPERVQFGLGWKRFDAEGRWLQADFADYSVISLYVPSGSSSEERQEWKFEALARLISHLKQLKRSGRELVICGDINIAHRNIDLKNWRSNQKNSGFLPAERAWLDRLFDQVGYRDVYRSVYPDKVEYTWWSNRGRAWDNNVGWRLDYQIATPGIAARAQAASVYTRKRFSDHAPLVIDYDWPNQMKKFASADQESNSGKHKRQSLIGMVGRCSIATVIDACCTISCVWCWPVAFPWVLTGLGNVSAWLAGARCVSRSCDWSASALVGPGVYAEFSVVAVAGSILAPRFWLARPW